MPPSWRSNGGSYDSFGAALSGATGERLGPLILSCLIPDGQILLRQPADRPQRLARADFKRHGRSIGRSRRACLASVAIVPWVGHPPASIASSTSAILSHVWDSSAVAFRSYTPRGIEYLFTRTPVPCSYGQIPYNPPMTLRPRQEWFRIITGDYAA